MFLLITFNFDTIVTMLTHFLSHGFEFVKYDIYYEVPNAVMPVVFFSGVINFTSFSILTT